MAGLTELFPVVSAKAWITNKLCSRHFQPQNVSRSVGRHLKSSEKCALDIGGRAVLNIIGKPRSEYRFVQAARIIERARCNMIILNIASAQKAVG